MYAVTAVWRFVWHIMRLAASNLGLVFQSMQHRPTDTRPDSSGESLACLLAS